MQSYVQAGGQIRPALAWCDAPQSVFALIHPQGQGRQAQLLEWQVQGGTLTQRPPSSVTLQDTDAGAGQVYQPFAVTAGLRRGQPGVVRSSNVENVQDPAYRMTRISTFTLDTTEHRCRYVPQAAFLGVTAKRTVIVWENGGKATYATRTFDGTPGVFVQGGVSPADVRLNSPQGFTGLYTWTVAGGITYHLDLRRNELAVRQRGRTVLRESFLAYSVSTRVPMNVTPTTKETP